MYDTYGDIKDALAGSDPNLDMATLPTFTYLVAEEESEVELDPAGGNSMRPDPLSTSGWIIPEITMRAEGIDISGLTIVEGNGHDSVIRGVYDGAYDDGSGDPAVTVDAGVDPADYVE